MKKPKILIAGVIAAALFSTQVYAASIQKDISELKGIIPNIITIDDVCYKQFERKEHNYKIKTPIDDELELEVYHKGSGKTYKFIDEGSDSTLDVYIGSEGFKFTSKNTPAEKWKKLKDNYHKFIRDILPLAVIGTK